MADTPHAAHRPRPLSPHVFHYGWSVTMATSITHRFTGGGLAVGTVLLAWWLFAVANGFIPYNQFISLAATPLGQVILFGITWSLSYHLLNGIRHLVWDMGYGYSIGVARATSILVIIGSIVLAAGLFALAYAGYGGFYK